MQDERKNLKIKEKKVFGIKVIAKRNKEIDKITQALKFLKKNHKTAFLLLKNLLVIEVKSKKDTKITFIHPR